MAHRNRGLPSYKMVDLSMAMLDNSLTTTVTALAVTFWLKHPRVLDNSPCFFRFFGTPGSQKAMDPSPISKVITALLKEGWAVFNSLKCHGNLDHWGDQYLLIPVWWFGTWLLFFHVLGIVTPTDFHIFQRGRSTTNQWPWMLANFCNKRMTESPTK